VPGSTASRLAGRLLLALVLVAVITAVDFNLLHVNGTTAAFTFLILVLALATRGGLQESIAASLVSAASYNYYFLPPVRTFTISDPQNWIALCAFLVTAVTASQLSSQARRRAEEARARERELQHLYDFSRSLLLFEDDVPFAQHAVRQVIAALEANDAALYVKAAEPIERMSGRQSFDPETLKAVAESGRAWHDDAGLTLIVPVSLGATSLGSLAVRGERPPSEAALQAIAQLISIALERARVQAVSARLEATRENEQLKSALLDALAHEFKTPLTSVKAAATTLLSANLPADAQRELAMVVDEESDRMTRLVTDSIELARVGTGPITLHKRSQQVSALVESVLDSFRVPLEDRDVQIDMSPALPEVWVDKELTELVLRQIMSNALKYSPPRSAIRIEAQRQEGAISVGITNQGTGIERPDRERVFEKFYRGRSVRDRVPGTGMGLSIARDIIQAQGGHISFQTEIDQGATFTVTFPLDQLTEKADQSGQVLQT
jgi:two-component system, OmpR family, sensor histidine kinase KdpD